MEIVWFVLCCFDAIQSHKFRLNFQGERPNSWNTLANCRLPISSHSVHKITNVCDGVYEYGRLYNEIIKWQ